MTIKCRAVPIDVNFRSSVVQNWKMSTVQNGIVFKVITLHLRAENIAHD